MLIDIVILPPEKLRRKMGEGMKKEIGTLPNFFVVDNVKFIPHLSLWHMKTSSKGVKEVENKLKQVTGGLKPIRVSTSSFRASKHYKGNVEFSVNENKDIVQLQKKIFEKIYHFKSGMMPTLTSMFGSWTGEILKEVKKYGRPLKFIPHFTMGWLKNEEDVARVVRKMQKTKLRFTAKEVYICEVNKWWQVKRIIKKIEF